MKFIPFSYSWIMRKQLKGAKTVLDVGCGDGQTMASINPDRQFDVTGIDLYSPYLKLAAKTRVYKKLLLKDIRELKREGKQYDVVFSSQVVEHLTKKEALKLIKVMEALAKKRVIIGTTNGFFPFDPIQGKDKNPLQVHKCGWEMSEMKRLGYTKIYGQGLHIIYKPGGLAHRTKNKYMFRLFSLLSFIYSPVTYFFPSFSTYIIATKEICVNL